MRSEKQGRYTGQEGKTAKWANGEMAGIKDKGRRIKDKMEQEERSFSRFFAFLPYPFSFYPVGAGRLNRFLNDHEFQPHLLEPRFRWIRPNQDKDRVVI